MTARPFQARRFGSTGLEVGPIGLGSSYGVGGKDLARAFDRGVRFFLWGSRRRPYFADGLRDLMAHRSEMTIAIQTYTRAGWLTNWSVDRALRALRTDYVDVLGLAWWNGEPPARIVESALRLKERGKVRHLMLSSHHRPLFQQVIDGNAFDAMMLRYNAAHPGAEKEVFPHLARRRPGVLAFTATRWGHLLDPRYVPEGEPVPRASDCYRFALTNPNVDVCLAGPRNGEELDEALAAVDRGPMSDDELAWMRRVGANVRAATQKNARAGVMGTLDRLARALSCEKTPKQLPAA